MGRVLDCAQMTQLGGEKRVFRLPAGLFVGFFYFLPVIYGVQEEITGSEKSKILF